MKVESLYYLLFYDDDMKFYNFTGPVPSEEEGRASAAVEYLQKAGRKFRMDSINSRFVTRRDVLREAPQGYEYMPSLDPLNN